MDLKAVLNIEVTESGLVRITINGESESQEIWFEMTPKQAEDTAKAILEIAKLARKV